MARRYTITASHQNGQWAFRCIKAPKFGIGSGAVVPPDTWEEAAGEEAEAIRLLRGLLNQQGVHLTNEEMVVTEDLVASWEVPPGELEDVGLPPVCPFRLSISSAKPISDVSGSIKLQWLSADYLPVPAITRSGTLLKTGRRSFLLRDPLRSLADAVDATNAAADVNERMRRFAIVQRLLMEMTDQAIAPDNLKNMVIYQATALGIQTETGDDGYIFHPELLGDIPGETEDSASRRVPLLSQFERERFNRRMNEAWLSGNEEARPSYVLSSNTYVVLDPGVRAALEVVQKVSKADRKTREKFFGDTMSFLLPALEAVGSDGSVVEFSERVIGVSIWEGSSKLGGSDGDHEWFPDPEASTFIIRDEDGRDIAIPGKEAERIVSLIKQAIIDGEPTVTVGGEVYRIGPQMIDQVMRIPVVQRPHDPYPVEPPTDDPLAEGQKPETKRSLHYFYVKPKGNVEELTYIEDRAALRGEEIKEELDLRNEPKQHQAEGITWMRRGYLAGMRGLLMADDMGLGKTFQVLAFLKWLRQRLEDRRKTSSDPLFMIVAPKSLLGNWLEELEMHIGKDGLGRPAMLYGENLKQFRMLKEHKLAQGDKRDIRVGAATLDLEKIKGHDWVLTTYETLRDYQISLARVTFEVVTFDEAQKVKESGAMVTEAARAQKAASLRILMTGTPVENGLMDLWTLMDIAWPGRLGYSAADFKKRFATDKNADLSEIKRLLTEPTSDNNIVVPQLMLRRMKDEVAALPPKRFRSERETMPQVQAVAYSKAFELQARGPGGALVALQAIRNISLHPNLQAPIDFRDERSVDDFINMSARFKVLFRILDEIKARDEKALVFIDLRRAQAVLAELIKHRYKLQHLPHVINGETKGEVRDSIRQGFQRRRGFEVLMLAPRAAGFGLTLHAANHVIHLNRWWNPAVEDQCTDRAYRIGQEKDVTVWIPIAEHPELGTRSYDAVLDRLLELKRSRSRDVIVPVQFDAAELANLHATIFGESPIENDVANMDWKRFEEWTLQRIIEAGFVADRTPPSGDAGADMIVRSPTQRDRGAIVQVKHRSGGKLGRVSDREVIDVLRARERYPLKNPSMILVTNGSVEPSGHAVAKAHAIAVVDYSTIERVGDIVRSKLHADVCA
jgi:hypothetical protein